jgi:sec-independent protein translocase protein TatB
MFGIGLPELILILALALIVVGPDKLPDLARSLAKGILELKKTANTLKESLTEEGNPLADIKPEFDKAVKSLTDDVMGEDDNNNKWTEADRKKNYYPKSSEENKASQIIDVESKTTTGTTEDKQNTTPEEKPADNSKTKEIHKEQAKEGQQR